MRLEGGLSPLGTWSLGKGGARFGARRCLIKSAHPPSLSTVVFSQGGPTARTMMRRAVLAAAFSVLCSVGAFHVGPGMQGSRWVRPVPTSSSSTSRPGEKSCTHSSMSMMGGFVCPAGSCGLKMVLSRGTLCLYPPMYIYSSFFPPFKKYSQTIMSFVHIKPIQRVMHTTRHLTVSLERETGGEALCAVCALC